jgi:RND family efflux transporter MFP subunit
MSDNSQQKTDKTFSLSGKRWSFVLGSLLLVMGIGWVGNGWLSSRTRSNAPASESLAGQPPAIPVKLETLETGTLEDSSDVVGTLEARRSVTLKPEIDGRISEILVKEGDRVQPGQAIVRLDSDDLEAELQQAKAGLANAQAKLAELKAGSRTEDIAQARASLKEAQARLANAQVGASPEAIAQAKAQLEAAEAEADLARERVKRYAQLKEQGAISIDQYEEYLKQARSTAAAVQEAKRRLAELSKSRSSNIDELAAAVEQERQNLRRLEKGPRSEEIAQAQAQVAQAEAQVQMAAVKLQKTQIRGPWKGVIGDIPIKIGDYVEKADTLTTLTQNNALELNLSIPLERAADLRLGLPVEMLDDQGKAIATGEISFISPDVTANSQLILAKASLSNLNRDWLNRQFIQARVIWNRRSGILIPAAAVSRLGGQTFVFVAQKAALAKGGKPQLIAQQKQVKLGNLQGNNYQVLEGLKAGEQIVTAGILNLTDGAPIQPISSKQSPALK